ncbi:zinc finger protein 525-like [Cydia pomonella]|uniref:zinc finger protein 525-like n=1 Tax=Cydia pomonella TaxID=82600 RepID=UPI002ADD9F9C|nr:zinc finger protein 525-like [Cydia pomonella]
MEVWVKVKEEPSWDAELGSDYDCHGHVAETGQSSDTMPVVKKEALNTTEEYQNILETAIDDLEKTIHIKVEELEEENVDKKEAPDFEHTLNTKKIAQNVKTEASPNEELYADGVVKDELVLSPETVQMPHKVWLSEEHSLLVRELDTAEQHRYECDICGKVYQRKHFLVRHIKMHSKFNKGYPCNICIKVFSKRSALNRHELSHTGAKNFSCETCNKKFTQKGHLNDHKLTHTGERPYACNMCSMQFKRSTHLIVHKRSHTGETPYSCEFCEKKFRSSGGLVSHRRIHTGEKAQYACDICNKTFSSNRDLTRHQRVHTGEKPFVCEICKKAYKQDAHLKTHLKTHTGDS